MRISNGCRATLIGTIFAAAAMASSVTQAYRLDPVEDSSPGDSGVTATETAYFTWFTPTTYTKTVDFRAGGAYVAGAASVTASANAPGGVGVRVWYTCSDSGPDSLGFGAEAMGTTEASAEFMSVCATVDPNAYTTTVVATYVANCAPNADFITCQDASN